ncbi:MAG: AmmeMemoRadiSam system protein B [Magnetococcales bacterium]|nr:AmmeMemoRadiSam system protein B [Magnetococcales bacterium]
MNTERVRSPAVAGMFYPGDATVLRTMVEGLLAQVPPVAEEPLAVIAPHAGFVYSGLTAAHAYKGLRRAPAEAPRRVWLIGPSHRVWLRGASVGDYDAYVTPLGLVAVDQAGVALVASRPGITRDEAPHRLEHSLETQLPFLQVTLGHFSIVPIVYGEMGGDQLAEVLAACWQPGDLIVISTDLSHFHTYEEAKKRDAQSHAAILACDSKAMSGCEACGSIGVQAMLAMARRRQWRPELADLRNSGDTAGDKQRVVGYASYLFYPEPPASAPAPVPAPVPTIGLPELVRAHLTATLSGQPGLSPAALAAQWGALAGPGACFVTLTERGALRGCIGSLVAHRSLAEDLLGNGMAAATQDPRFPPVRAQDLAGIAIEVSLLSAPQPFPHRDGEELIRLLKPGIHGVILTKQGRRATFLPQVWEQLPDPVDFLSHLCRKAGLDGACWRQGAEIQVYTVEKRVEGAQGAGGAG